MARALSCLATLLAARNALVQAKPVHDERPLPTLDMRPIRVVTELGVSLSKSFPAPTNLVFCNGETLSISQAGFLSTVTTITHTQNASISRFAPCGTMGSDQIAPASTCDCAALSIGVAGVGLVGPMGLAGPQGLPGPPGPACTKIYTGDAGAGAGEEVGAGAGEGVGTSVGAGAGTGAGTGAGAGAGAEGGAGADSGDAGASAGEGAEGNAGSGGDQSESLPAEAGNGGAGNGDTSGGSANNGNNSTNSTNSNGGNGGNGGYGGDGGELDPIISSIVGQLTTLMPTDTGAVPTDVAPIVSSLIGDLSSLFPTGIPTSILPAVTSVNNGNNGNNGNGGNSSNNGSDSTNGNGNGGNYGNGGYDGDDGDDGAQSALATELDPIISSIVGQLTTLLPTATDAVPTDVAPIVSSLIGDLSSLFPTGIPTSILPAVTSVNNGNSGNSGDGGAQSALATGLDPIISSIVGQLTTLLPTATSAVPTDVTPIVSSLIGDLSSLFPTGIPTSILPTATEVNNGDGGNYGSGGGDDGAQSALTTGLDPIISSIVGQLTTLVPTATSAVPTDVAPIVSSLIGDLSSLFPTGIPTSILPTSMIINSSLPLSTEVQSVVSSLPSSLPTGPLSSIIEGVVSVVTNVLPTNTITNLPTCAPGNPVCAIAPEACRKIGDISDADSGSQLAPQVAECTAALGPYAKDPNVLICIGNVAIGPGHILACLTNALSEVCITALPGACTNLLGVPATQLSSATPQCGLALGPFLVDDSNKCLTGTLTSGDAVVSCLEKALGLTVCVPTPSGGSTKLSNLATETEALTLPLPSEVQSILNEVTGLVPTLLTLPTLPSSPTLPSEVQSIVNEVTSLLPTSPLLPSEVQSIVNEITTLLPTLPTEVQSIVNEITTLLPTLPTLPTCSASPPVCASVPQDCNAIGKISGLGAVTQLPEQIVKCTTALGSFAASPAVASCLGNMAQGPTAIVNCLTTSLKSVCITELPGACTNLVGEPAAQLPSVAPQCALALGPFLVSDASQCLSGTPTSGDAVISCLQKAIGLSTCVPTVSGESTQVGNLATETEALTLPLLSQVQSIVDEATTLSPTLPTLPSMVQTVVEGVTTTLPILSVSLPVDQISSIIGAITNAVPSNTISSLATCSAGPPVCASVPQDCNAIGKISGLGAVTQLPGQIVKCTTALGSFATNPAVASCLANVAQGPTAIVNCLTTSLKSVCITALPGACTNLLGEPAAQLPSIAPQCALALGPFL
ncbi:hypothetical protein E4U14_002758, partial [Claviceps sp. LM454 group G7]